MVLQVAKKTVRSKNTTPQTASIISSKIAETTFSFNTAIPQVVTIRGSTSKPAAGNSNSRATAYIINPGKYKLVKICYADKKIENMHMSKG